MIKDMAVCQFSAQVQSSAKLKHVWAVYHAII